MVNEYVISFSLNPKQAFKTGSNLLSVIKYIFPAWAISNVRDTLPLFSSMTTGPHFPEGQ